MNTKPHPARVAAARADQLCRIFDHSNDAGFILAPSEDRIVDVNVRACELLGYSREEVLALSISDVHPDEMPRFRAFAPKPRSSRMRCS